MITASKNNIPATTYPFLEAKNSLKKTVSNNYINAPIPTEQEPVPEQENQQERTLALISCNDHLNDIINYIKEKGFSIIQSKTIQLTLDQAKTFYEDHATQNYYDKMVRWLSNGSNVCALILEKENAVKDWRSLMGPTAYKKARKSSPNSIRALFGKDASQNATHGSDSDASSKKEIEFIFGHSSLVKDSANLPHVKNDDVNSTIEHDIMKKGTILLDTEDLVTIDLNSSSIADTTKSDSQDVAANEAEESDVTEEKLVVDSTLPINDEKSDTVAEIVPVTPVSTIDETPVVTADGKQEEVQTINSTDKLVDITPTITETVSPAVVIEGELKNKTVLVADNEMKVKEAILVSADKNLTNDESVTDKDMKVEEVVSTGHDLKIKETVPAATEKELKEEETVPGTSNSNLNEEHIVPAIAEEILKVEESNDILESQENELTITEEPKENAPSTIKVEEPINTQKDSVDINFTTAVNSNHGDCITMTPTPSIKDEKPPVLTHIEKENNAQEKVEEVKDITSDEIGLNSNISEADLTPMTPPAEPNDVSTASSSATVVNETQDKKSNTPTIRSNSAEKKAPLIKKQSVRSEVKSETVVPSSSRIRPPSIKRGQNGNMIRSGEPIGQSRITNNKITSANSSAATTRIARLSPSATVKNEPPVVEKKKSTIAREVPKKPATKVSRNLPRVATIVTQKPPVKKEEEVEKKPKKRVSSTRSFITRLTAPTVASQNKKADNEPGTPVTRRATLPTKRNVGSSSSKEITTRK